MVSRAAWVSYALFVGLTTLGCPAAQVESRETPLGASRTTFGGATLDDELVESIVPDVDSWDYCEIGGTVTRRVNNCVIVSFWEDETLVEAMLTSTTCSSTGRACVGGRNVEMRTDTTFSETTMRTGYDAGGEILETAIQTDTTIRTRSGLGSPRSLALAGTATSVIFVDATTVQLETSVYGPSGLLRDTDSFHATASLGTADCAEMADLASGYFASGLDHGFSMYMDAYFSGTTVSIPGLYERDLGAFSDVLQDAAHDAFLDLGRGAAGIAIANGECSLILPFMSGYLGSHGALVADSECSSGTGLCTMVMNAAGISACYEITCAGSCTSTGTCEVDNPIADCTSQPTDPENCADLTPGEVVVVSLEP